MYTSWPLLTCQWGLSAQADPIREIVIWGPILCKPLPWSPIVGAPRLSAPENWLIRCTWPWPSNPSRYQLIISTVGLTQWVTIAAPRCLASHHDKHVANVAKNNFKNKNNAFIDGWLVGVSLFSFFHVSFSWNNKPCVWHWEERVVPQLGTSRLWWELEHFDQVWFIHWYSIQPLRLPARQSVFPTFVDFNPTF